MHYMEYILDWQKNNKNESGPLNKFGISITAASRLSIKTTSIFITEPIVNIGLISMRILLEFMGLKYDKNTKSLTSRKNRTQTADDIWIEDFNFKNKSTEVALSLVTTEEIREMCPRHHEKVVEALALTIRDANKGIAHLTNHRVEDSNAFDRYCYAAAEIRRLLKEHFYKPIGEEYPTIKIHLA